AVAADEQVRGHLQVADRVEVRVRVAVEAVREKVLDVRPAELAGRQADVVQHHERDVPGTGPLVLVRRGTQERRPDEAGLGTDAITKRLPGRQRCSPPVRVPPFYTR